jgi:hypothetical protein
MKILLAILFFCITTSTQGKCASTELIGPSLIDFGYKSVNDVITDLSNLDEIQNFICGNECKWYHVSCMSKFTREEYFLIKNNKTKNVFFAFARHEHSVVQVFGPLRNINE